MKLLTLLTAIGLSASGQQNEAEWELDVLLNVGAKPPLQHLQHWSPEGTRSLWPRVEELLVRAQPENEVFAEAAAWLGVELVRAGQDVRGFRIQDSALARTAHLGDDHQLVQRLLDAKATALHETHRFRRSAEVRERIATARRDGPEETLNRALFDLALAFRLAGQLDRAEPLLQALYRDGAEGVRYSDLQDELGLVLDALGRVAEADTVRDGRERPAAPIRDQGRSCHFGLVPPERAIDLRRPLTVFDIIAMGNELSPVLRLPREAAHRILDAAARQLAVDHLKASPEMIDRAWTALSETAARLGFRHDAERMLRTQIELIETHRGLDSPSLEGPREMLANIHRMNPR